MLRKSSFDMARVGDEDIEGGLRKFLDTRKGASEKTVGLGRGAPKICILQNQQEGRRAPKKIEPLAKGAAKISSFELQYLHSPLVILNELSLKTQGLDMKTKQNKNPIFRLTVLITFLNCYQKSCPMQRANGLQLKMSGQVTPL